MRHKEFKNCHHYNGTCKMFLDQNGKYWNCDEVEKNGNGGTCLGMTEEEINLAISGTRTPVYDQYECDHHRTNTTKDVCLDCNAHFDADSMVWS